MASEWKTDLLGNLCLMKNGYAFKSKDFVSQGIPVIKIKNVKPNRILVDDLSYVPADVAEQRKKWLIEKGEILLTMTGNRADGSPESWVGKAAIFNESTPYLLNQRVSALKAKDEAVIDTNYLGYYLSSWQTQLYFIKRANSSGGQANISPEIVMNMPVHYPPLATQRKIVSILATLDQKINTNAAINDNLYDLLQSVYQLQFGVTSGNAAEGTLSDICSYTKDRIAVSELSLGNYYSTENMLPGKAGFTEATSLPTTPQTTRCNAGDVLVSNIRPYFKKIVLCHSEGGCSTDVLCFAPKAPAYSAYLFCTLYADRFFDFMVAGSKGTKMPRGDKQQIMTYPVYIPTESELTAFADFATPILSQIHGNNEENARLEHLRDTLLPKLMSGEIDVSAIDI